MSNKTIAATCTNKKEVDARPFEYALSLIGGKWKLNILFWLWRKDIMRYNELKKALCGITHKMLSNQLKELESCDLIVRHEYPQVPPKVEYYLSERGKSLMPILHELCEWGGQHIDD
ncbi:winged helix-turn-helix transcriptional regulator [Konateibacter massiliensis]|uniref:winged helix-turn-helix transcriptional regulator n=1 Tax=Konateibacter massiliensis TaxID=2002841 RepID=UPI000C1545EA|nr:helix-turn-helix domain-containing protein [Konateibacter massiliensis]